MIGRDEPRPAPAPAGMKSVLAGVLGAVMGFWLCKNSKYVEIGANLGFAIAADMELDDPGARDRARRRAARAAFVLVMN